MGFDTLANGPHHAAMRNAPTNETALRGWELGQLYLVAGRYMPARRALESAEWAAWDAGDAALLARIRLPLLETCRQIRYQAVEGVILIEGLETLQTPAGKRALKQFLQQPAGTLVLCAPARHDAKNAALKIAERVERHARRTGQWLEVLIALQHGHDWRLTSPLHPTFAAGLPLTWSNAMVGPVRDEHLVIPLPAYGTYTKGDPHDRARESLLVAWEALGTRTPEALEFAALFQADDLTPDDHWYHLALLRRALTLDPANEPLSMKLIATAEALERQKT